MNQMSLFVTTKAMTINVSLNFLLGVVISLITSPYLTKADSPNGKLYITVAVFDFKFLNLIFFRSIRKYWVLVDSTGPELLLHTFCGKPIIHLVIV